MTHEKPKPGRRSETTRCFTAKGFTLVELLITVAVIAISMSIAVPSMRTTLERSWLQGATESIAAELRYARSESIKRNQPISVTFNSANSWASVDWCVGITEGTECDCMLEDPQNADACTLTVGGEKQIKTITFEDYSNVRVWKLLSFTDNRITFDPVRGTANSGFVLLRSPEKYWTLIRTSVLGRSDICSNSMAAYTQCF